jgi:DNA-binding NarL/FixJ family response regulator
MSVIDAITTIRAQFAEARIIVLTIYPGDVQVTRASQVGVHGYILKGLPRKELLETIRAGGLAKVGSGEDALHGARTSDSRFGRDRILRENARPTRALGRA